MYPLHITKSHNCKSKIVDSRTPPSLSKSITEEYGLRVVVYNLSDLKTNFDRSPLTTNMIWGSYIWPFWFENKVYDLSDLKTKLNPLKHCSKPGNQQPWYWSGVSEYSSFSTKRGKRVWWGLGLYKENEELYQEELYLPSVLRLLITHMWYDCG